MSPFSALVPWARASPPISLTRACPRCFWILWFPGQPNRNAAALKGIENASKQRPGGFFTDDKIALIQPGNFEDDLQRVRECDWILEAVVENLELKRDLWRKVDAARKHGCDSFHQHQRNSAGADFRGFLSRSSAGISWARISSIRRAICI